MIVQGKILDELQLGNPDSVVKFTFEGEPEVIDHVIKVIEQSTELLFE